MRIKITLLILILAITLTAFTGCITVVKIGEEGKLTGETDFNASSDVESIWETEAIPDLEAKAVDLQTFLTEANGALSSLAEKYGKYSMGTSGELSYVVKGTGKITAVDQTKRTGFMTISVEGYTGDEVVMLQIGPVFKGSAVRDSLSIIKYENFKNQVEWAAISQSIHDLIQETVINSLDLKTITDKTIDFTGCFTVNGNDELLITPIEITVK